MQIQKGETVEGKITGITKYGAFVNIDGENSGMIHISEISAEFIKDINEILKINQPVKAVVIGVNENGKLALSIKQLNQTNQKETGFAKPEKTIKTEKNEKPEKNTKTNTGSISFEDMMNKFKRESDEKISDLKFLEPKRTGSSRRRKD